MIAYKTSSHTVSGIKGMKAAAMREAPPRIAAQAPRMRRDWDETVMRPPKLIARMQISALRKRL